jgi:hypothetical protein
VSGDASLSPIPAITKCNSCGGPARLDHLSPDLTAPIDRVVYRCASCSALTVVDRPRRPPSASAPNPDHLVS